MLDLKKIPKIDLHCHLDGSIAPDLLLDWKRGQGEEMSPDRLREMVVAPKRCRSLMEYLDRFDLPLDYVQEEGHLRDCAHRLAQDASKEGVLYLEARFAPGTSLRRGLTAGQAIDAVLEGLKRAEAECGIRTGLICCAMRHQSQESNLFMLEEARERLGAGVVAVDLAGDEATCPNVLYRDFFSECRRLDMPFTIHSGETGSAKNVEEALALGALRIGHGIAMQGRRDLEKACADRGVGVELCPSSNLQTGACSDWGTYPLREFLDAGVKVSINTDNRTVSATTETRELELGRDRLGLTDSDLERIYRDSVDMAFADDSVKQQLLNGWNIING